MGKVLGGPGKEWEVVKAFVRGVVWFCEWVGHDSHRTSECACVCVCG